MPGLSAGAARARRAHSLRAAFRCLARKGFAKTSMSDLYREAGASAGSVYTWFRSKEEIIESAYRENTTRVTDLIADLPRRWEALAALAELVRTAAGRVDRPEWGEALANHRLASRTRARATHAEPACGRDCLASALGSR